MAGRSTASSITGGRRAFPTPTLLVPAPLARSIRFDERLRRHQDWDFCLRLQKSGAHFVYCHEPLAEYWCRDNQNRVSQQPSIEPTLFWIETARDIIAPDAAAAFYFRKTFRKHVAQSPGAAVLTALRLTLGSARATLWVAGKIVGHARDLLLPRAGSTRH
jgi:hypothetical protein